VRNVRIPFTGALLVTCLVAPPIHGTTIVVLQTPDEVVLGADARAISLRLADGTGATTKGQMCKIVRTPRTAVAIAGILGNLADFDAAAFVRQNLQADATLPVSADHLAQSVLPQLSAVIDQLEKNAPGQSLVVPGRPVLSIVLTRFEDAGMKVAIRDVVFTGVAGGGPEFRVQSTNCPGECRGPHMIFAAGASEAVTRFLISRPPHPRLKDPAFAVDLLRLEAAAEPDIVGPPFSILHGDSTGFRWIDAGACQEEDVTPGGGAR